MQYGIYHALACAALTRRMRASARAGGKRWLARVAPQLRTRSKDGVPAANTDASWRRAKLVSCYASYALFTQKTDSFEKSRRPAHRSTSERSQSPPDTQRLESKVPAGFGALLPSSISPRGLPGLGGQRRTAHAPVVDATRRRGRPTPSRDHAGWQPHLPRTRHAPSRRHHAGGSPPPDARVSKRRGRPLPHPIAVARRPATDAGRP